MMKDKTWHLYLQDDIKTRFKKQMSNLSILFILIQLSLIHVQEALESISTFVV